MGGHCLPVDPFYLAWRAREYDMPTEFIELAGKINQQMPYHCVELIERALNDVSKPVRGSHIAVLGVSYKGGVGDTRESPALRIMRVLRERGAELVYHDAFVPSLAALDLSSASLEDAVAGADAVVLVTAHPGIDHAAIAREAALFVDLRGATRGTDAGNVVRL
jgi:UDP-N-acetyl-D-glucosamine dehydrogenase